MDAHVYLAILVLVTLDYVTGIVAGCMTEGFSSSKMRKGLVHKATYLVAILVCLCIEYLSLYLDLGFAFGSGITALVCVWIVLSEVGSIIENISKMNPELADNSFMRLFAVNKKGEDDD